MRSNILRVGVGGPVGSGKTSLIDALCKRMRERYHIAVVTNDIYTQEDAQILTRSQALEADHIVGVETGGCPHTAIREDASMNLAAIDALTAKFPDLDFVLVERGGDKIPRKGGPGITRSDLLVINKVDLAPMVGASLTVMQDDTLRMRGQRPFVFTNIKEGIGLDRIEQFIVTAGMLEAA